MLKKLVTLNSTCNASNTASNRISIHNRRRRGVVIYYMTFAMIALCGVCSLAVDLGRVQVTKAELRRGRRQRRSCGGGGTA